MRAVRFLSARDALDHSSSTPMPGLFLACRAITRLEKTRSRERGGLILSVMLPREQQDVTLTCQDA